MWYKELFNKNFDFENLSESEINTIKCVSENLKSLSTEVINLGFKNFIIKTENVIYDFKYDDVIIVNTLNLDNNIMYDINMKGHNSKVLHKEINNAIENKINYYRNIRNTIKDSYSKTLLDIENPQFMNSNNEFVETM